MKCHESIRAMGGLPAALGVGLVLLLTACGGGGGGGGGDGGSGGSGGTTVTLSADVYPALASGDRRTWRMTAGGAVGALRHERVGDTVSAAGGAYVVHSGTNDLSQPADDEYLQRTSVGVMSVPGPNSDALSRSVGAVEVLRFGVPQGQAVVLFDRTVSGDFDGDGHSDSTDLHIEMQFAGTESVTTTLGSFTAASRVRTVVRSTIRLAAGGGSHNITQTIDDWYVAGIGSVRTTTTTNTDGLATAPETEELVAYAVGDRHSEQVAPTVTSAMPLNGSLGRPDAEVQLAFSEPIDPLSLNSNAGLVLTLNGSPVAGQSLQLSADGKTLKVFTNGHPLADGSYELRNGGQITDWAGNAAPSVLSSFRVDTVGPKLQAVSPSQAAVDVATSATFTFTFDEPVVVPAGVVLQVMLGPEGSALEAVPATLQGNSVVATPPRLMRINTAYIAVVGQGLQDAAGNPMAQASVSFRTDPGPLSRPQVMVPDAVVDAVMVADLDGDGRSDLVFAARKLGSANDYFIGLRRQQADGRYAEAVRLYSLPSVGIDGVRGLTVGDVDGDGRADVIVNTGASSVAPTLVLRQQGDGTFTAENLPVSLSLALLGTLDLGTNQAGVVGVATDGFTHLRRLVNGSWQRTLLIPLSAPNVLDWRLADLDGDGRADLIWLQSTADGLGCELMTSLRMDSGWGAAQSTRLPTGTPTGFAVADFDGDGRPDVALAAGVTAPGPRAANEIWLLTHISRGKFNSLQQLASDYGATAVLAGDLDGDGRADLIVAHSTTSRLGVYLQNASGSLDAERLFESSYGYFEYHRQLAIADLNGDGMPDIVQAEVVLFGRPISTAWPQAVRGMPAVAAPTAARLLRGAARAARAVN